MAKYVNITKQEMDEFLTPQGFIPITLDNTVELVYAKRVDQDGLALSLRVYTGINPTGESRGVGDDAIRCNIFWRKPENGLKKVATSKRVHRVAGWKKNLQDRIDTLHIEAKCIDCGSPMVERKGRNGVFLGCSSYPDCTHTEKKES